MAHKNAGKRGKVKEEYLSSNYREYFTKGKIYVCTDTGQIVSDCGATGVWSTYCEPISNKRIIGGEVL